jgi:WD40 repeat protein
MRYQSASELAADLRRFTEDRPILARRASSAEQAWRWCRRNPAVASLVSAVVLVSVIGATVAGIIARQQQRTAHNLTNTLEKQERTSKELEQTLGEKDRTAKELDKTLGDLTARQKDLLGQQDFTRRLLHVSRINQAQAALNDGRIPRVMELLRETTPKAGEPDLRGWEWHYLNGLFRPDREVVLANADDPPADQVDRGFVPVNQGFVSPTGLRTTFSLSHTGERVLVDRLVADGQYFEVMETLTGRLIGRVPRTGFFPGIRAESGRAQAATQWVFSADGKHLLVFLFKGQGTAEDPRTRNMEASRLWNVDTGEAISIPARLAEAVNLSTRAILGPDAASLTWLRLPPSPVSFFSGPVEVVCCRWDRASGEIAESKPFPIGRDTGWPALTPDGATVFWLEQRVLGKGKQGSINPDERIPPVAMQSPWFECWDVTTVEKPVPRFEPRRLPPLAAWSGASAYANFPTFDYSANMVAYRPGPDEVIVYRIADGEEYARFPLTGILAMPPEPLNPRTQQFFVVSDDGNRVVVRTGYQIIVNEKTAKGIVSRRFLAADPGKTSAVYGAGLKLLADRKTFVDLLAVPRVRIWDVSRDRTEAGPVDNPSVGRSVERDGQQFRAVQTDDGRFVLEWPVKGQSDSRPIVVRERDKEIGREPNPPQYARLSAFTLADGHRLFIQYESFGGHSWRLYDIDRGLRQIDGGSGTVSRPEGVPYLIEQTDRGFVSTVLPVVPSFNLRDGRTGDVVRTVQLPEREVHFCGFDPTGQTYLVQSIKVQSIKQWNLVPRPRRVLSTAELAVAGSPFGINPLFDRNTPSFGGREAVPGAFGVQFFPDTIRVHLYETATGKERWSKDIVVERAIAVARVARFSPDGKRILVRFAAATPGPSGPPRIQDRLWVALPDGTVERDFVVEVPLNFSRAPLDDFLCSPDGRHVAVACRGEVLIWDLDTGKLRHRLTGHNGRGISIVYNADGSRLFTRDGSGENNRVTPLGDLVGGVPNETLRVHVWDMATGGELLTLTTPGGFLIPRLEFTGEKLYMRTGPGGGDLVFDGTPVKP